MKRVILLLLSISMLGFYSCTKDDDDNNDDNGGGTTVIELTNYISIDGTKTELTKDATVKEGLFYMIDATTGDSTFFSIWNVYIGTDDLVIGDTSLSGTFTGFYADIRSQLEVGSPSAGTYVANSTGDAIVPSYTKAVYAVDYDFAPASTVNPISGDNDIIITVDGDLTTFTFEGSYNGKAIKVAYTAKLNLIGAKKKGLQELK